MKKVLVGLLIFFAATAQAQFSKASLQASGLTCSMCSKAVKTALEQVSFVDKVQVDIKNQQYNLTFNANEEVDIDALAKAVQDAGFSVASLKVTVALNNLTLQKDHHTKIGGHNFHFLNSTGQQVNGDVTFSVVDKAFVSAREFRKYASMTKMACVQSGRMAKCCTKEATSAGEERIFHVII